MIIHSPYYVPCDASACSPPLLCITADAIAAVTLIRAHVYDDMSSALIMYQYHLQYTPARGPQSRGAVLHQSASNPPHAHSLADHNTYKHIQINASVSDMPTMFFNHKRTACQSCSCVSLQQACWKRTCLVCLQLQQVCCKMHASDYARALATAASCHIL